VCVCVCVCVGLMPNEIAVSYFISRVPFWSRLDRDPGLLSVYFTYPDFRSKAEAE
jgi:hypothetical protein